MRTVHGLSKVKDWRKCLEYFLLFKRAQGLAQRTLNDYQYHVELFFRNTQVDLEDYDDLRLAVMKYFADSSSLSPATFNTRRKTLKAFFSWTVSESITPENPIMSIKKRKEDELPRSVKEEVVEKLLTVINQKTFGGVRDYTLLILTMDTGIRPKEAFGLRMANFNGKGCEMIVPADIAKTRVSRTLPLSPITVGAINRLITVRHESWNKDVPLFCTEIGTMMTHYTWGRRMRIYSDKIGFKVRPYDLRHTFAVMFLRNGGNAFSLQRTLGHATLTMTKRYVALTESDIAKQHALASPLNTLIKKNPRVRGLKR